MQLKKMTTVFALALPLTFMEVNFVDGGGGSGPFSSFLL